MKFYLIFICFRGLFAELFEVNGSPCMIFTGLGIKLKQRILLTRCNIAIRTLSCLQKFSLNFLLARLPASPKPPIFNQCQETNTCKLTLLKIKRKELANSNKSLGVAVIIIIWKLGRCWSSFELFSFYNNHLSFQTISAGFEVSEFNNHMMITP